MTALDIGGEGRHAEAWNLNPSPVKTLGPEKGLPIPRRIAGRANAIPLPDHSVDRIIVESVSGDLKRGQRGGGGWSWPAEGSGGEAVGGGDMAYV
jgi:hypothetical protein